MTKKNNDISTTLEDYLEAILEISEKTGFARAKEIGEYFKIKGSSVTVAMRSLAEKGLVTYEPYSFIQLTPKGRTLAVCISNRHSVLKRFFINILHLDQQNAEECACKMEHGLTPQLCDRLSHLAALINASPDFSKKLAETISHTHPGEGCSSDCKCR